MRKRIEWLDFGKAFFMSLVVLAHALKSIYSRPVYAPNINFVLHCVGDVVFFIIMPAFFALSGYLYHKSENWHQFRKMIIKKAINLGVPYVIFSVVYVFLQHFSSGVNTRYTYVDLFYIWYQPIAYLWFLYILFFIFLLVDAFNLLKVDYRWQLLLNLIFFCIVVVLKLKLFVLQTFGWATFFIVGYATKVNAQIIQKNKSVLLLTTTILSLIGLSICFLVLGPNSDFNNLYLANVLPKLCVAFFSLLLCMNLNKNTPFFNYFRKYGSSSLIIYMIHPPLISVACVLMFKLIEPNVFVSVIILFLIGWFGSMIVVFLNTRWKWLHFIFNSYHAFQTIR